MHIVILFISQVGQRQEKVDEKKASWYIQHR